MDAISLPCGDAETRDWRAWINLMPPPPDDLHVIGEVRVPNPGVEAILVKTEPQGINPNILLLDLFLYQRPGVWPQVVAWKAVRYDSVTRGMAYTAVSVLCDSKPIQDIKVEEIH